LKQCALRSQRRSVRATACGSETHQLKTVMRDCGGVWHTPSTPPHKNRENPAAAPAEALQDGGKSGAIQGVCHTPLRRCNPQPRGCDNGQARIVDGNTATTPKLRKMLVHRTITIQKIFSVTVCVSGT